MVGKKKARVFTLELIMMIFSLIFLIPIWMVLVNSLKSSKEAMQFTISFPSNLHFENYQIVFQEGNLLSALCNGLFYCIIIGLFSIIFTSMAAFVISRLQTKLTEWFYYLFLAGIILPGAIIPTYFLLQKMQLVGSYLSVILVLLACTMPIGVFLYTGFIKGIPKDLDEAAMIDGAGKIRLFFQIIFPLLKSVTITLIIFNFMGVWNDVTTQLYFVDASKWTMPMSVYRFQGMYSSDWNLVFAVLVMTSIPVILIYIFGQKYMVSGMTQGSIKG